MFERTTPRGSRMRRSEKSAEAILTTGFGESGPPQSPRAERKGEGKLRISVVLRRCPRTSAELSSETSG